jgi:uncharacterized protein Veg
MDPVSPNLLPAVKTVLCAVATAKNCHFGQKKFMKTVKEKSRAGRVSGIACLVKLCETLSSMFIIVYFL